MNPSLRRFLMWGGALIVVLIAVSLIAGRTKVTIPVSTE
jgi:RNA polymerase subunit RPABC4/transcription elongation factor Spt4